MSKDRQERGELPTWWMIILIWVILAVLVGVLFSAKNRSATVEQSTPVIEQPVAVPVEKPAPKAVKPPDNLATNQSVANVEGGGQIVGEENPDGSVTFKVSLKRLKMNGLATK